MLTKLTKVLMGVSVLVLAALTAQAVEDGLGTNVIRNMRIQTNGVIDLGGTPITNWNQVGSTANVSQLQADLLMVSNKVDGLNTRSNAWNGAVVTAVTANAIADGLNTRSSTWNTAATIADGLNTRSNIWDGAAVTAVTANAIASGLNTRSNAWDNAVVIREGTAGETIAFSNLCYYKSSDSRWWQANATTNTTAQGLLGLALGGATAGNPIPSAGLLLNGYCTNNWGFAAGSVIYMSTNNGTLATNRPTGTNNIVRIVGYAINTTNIYFNPDRTYIEILGE